MSPQEFRIFLIGPELNENLSLRYLAGALIQQGYSQIELVPYNTILDAPTIARRIAREQPGLVGVSMAFQARAIDDMLLCELARREGFRGHITVGGQFVTLHYRDVFRDANAVDSVVLFEGERTIVELADALRADESVERVSSLAWRSGDDRSQTVVNPTSPAPEPIDDIAPPLRARSQMFLGLNAAFLVGSRGCHAACQYCCVAALATDRRQAAVEAGATAFVPGTRRRSPENVAREVAQLYHSRSARIFEFQDDNWIPPTTQQAVAYFETFRAALRRAGVGQIGLTLKLRADAVTMPVIELLQDIGLIRVFVGIESGSQSLLSKLGRTMREGVSTQALRILREHRVPAYFNALLFGPDLTWNEIEPELTFLEDNADYPFEVVEVVIYGRTGLHDKLAREGRLRGNYLAYDYQYHDARLRRTYEIVAALQTRHFGVYSPIKMAGDLGLNLGILKLFYPGPETDAAAEKVDALVRRINRDQLGVIREAAHWAEMDAPISVAGELLAQEAASRDLEFYQDILQLQRHMEWIAARGSHQPRESVRAYFRGGLVASGLIAGVLTCAGGKLLADEPPVQPTSPPSKSDAAKPEPRMSEDERRRVLELIGQLGNDKFTVRETALQQLTELAIEQLTLGNSDFRALLDQAAQSADTEIRARANSVISQTHYTWFTRLLSKDTTVQKTAENALLSAETSLRPLVASFVASRRWDPTAEADSKQLQALSNLLKVRRDADIDRLTKAVTAASPKLKVSTGLQLKVTKEGKVVGVSTHNGQLPQEIENAVVDLLAKQRFHLQEVTGGIELPKDKSGEPQLADYVDPTAEILLKAQTLRMRTGPLD